MVHFVRGEVVDDQILTTEVHHLGVPIKYTCPQPQLGGRPKKPKAKCAKRPAGSGDFGSPALSPQYMSVWKQRRGASALRVSEAEACPRHEKNAASKEGFVFWRRSAADPSFPLNQHC